MAIANVLRLALTMRSRGADLMSSGMNEDRMGARLRIEERKAFAGRGIEDRGPGLHHGRRRRRRHDQLRKLGRQQLRAAQLAIGVSRRAQAPRIPCSRPPGCSPRAPSRSTSRRPARRRRPRPAASAPAPRPRRRQSDCARRRLRRRRRTARPSPTCTASSIGPRAHGPLKITARRLFESLELAAEKLHAVGAAEQTQRRRDVLERTHVLASLCVTPWPSRALARARRALAR